MLNHILNIFYQKAHTVAAFNKFRNAFNPLRSNALVFLHGVVGFLDSHNNLAAVKINRRAVAFDYLHVPPSFSLKVIFSTSVLSQRRNEPLQ